MIGAGYGVFRFFLANVAGTFQAYSLLFLAVVAGIATFFSPCSFPLLPGYLALFTEETGGRRTVYYGSIAALGLLTFNVLLGGVIGLMGASFAKSFSITAANPSPITLNIRRLIALFLITMGIGQLYGSETLMGVFHRIKDRFAPDTGSGSSSKSIFTYGFGYTASAIGCAGPILAGLTVFALGAGGFAVALVTFLLYSLTMAALMISISYVVGRRGKGGLGDLAESTPRMQKVTSGLLLLIGLFLLYTTFNMELFQALFFM